MKATHGKYSGTAGVEEGLEVGACVDVGVEVTVGVAIGVAVGVGVGAGVEVGVGVGSGGTGGSWRANVVDGAIEFTAFRMGVKLTVPKFRSYLKSWIVRLIACMSVVSHQLYVALMFDGFDDNTMLF